MMKKEFYEWSCFIAQQSAEKAVEALLQKLNALAWGHSVFEMLTIISKKLDVVEVFPYTVEEQNLPFVQHALNQGIILFESQVIK